MQLYPNTANAGIAKVLALRTKGYNANEAYWLEFECVGYGSTYPVTVAEKQFCATAIGLLIVRPHSEHLDRPSLLENLVDQSVLKADTP
ncbi:MAG: hypothetical protein ABIV26_00980 [Candidatus Limnocylindrales bacterium]